MREVPGAEEALRDLEDNACHGKFFQALICRLAGEMAVDMKRRAEGVDGRCEW
jgi:hypothetical protein